MKAESGSNKVTVIGKVDPSKVREKLAEKTKKKVDLISPQPTKKENNNDDDKKKSQGKNNTTDEKKPKEKEVIFFHSHSHTRSLFSLNVRLSCSVLVNLF